MDRKRVRVLVVSSSKAAAWLGADPDDSVAVFAGLVEIVRVGLIA